MRTGGVTPFPGPARFVTPGAINTSIGRTELSDCHIEIRSTIAMAAAAGNTFTGGRLGEGQPSGLGRDLADRSGAIMACADQPSTQEIFESACRQASVLRRIPVATYRLQFNRAFTFMDARGLVPYLHELGISDCYASPYLQATAGSPHGYDTCNHNALNPEVGSEEDYRQFVEELARHGMGQIVDIVPNHMGIACNDNAWWMDILEDGPGSPYAAFFDIDWTPVKAELKNKVLLPILGDQYGKVLENQELTLAFQDGGFYVWYHDRRLPIAPRQYTQILEHRLDMLAERLGVESPQFLEFQSIIAALHRLPLPTEIDPEKVIERRREKEIITRRLQKLTHESEDVKRFLEDNVRIFNGMRGEPRSFDLLDTLLNAQVYRLAHWRVAAEEINYRRFFDVNDLAAIRTEDPAVFHETHRLIFRLIRERSVTGLRIDHPDGLYEPAEYFRRLQRGAFLEACRALAGSRGEGDAATWQSLEQGLAARYAAELAKDLLSPLRLPFYVIAEKILTKGERLPPIWPVDGTTGYDFLNQLNGLFVDTENARAFDDLYSKFIHAKVDFRELVYQKKKLIMNATMSSEINVLGRRLNKLSEKHRHSRDFTLNSLTEALRGIIACFPIYRTYIGEGDVTVGDSDRLAIERAVARAKQRSPATNVSIFDFIQDILCMRFAGYLGPLDRLEQRDFVMRFQQCTGPVMAKGLEDTAFYIYNRLASLNEVGGDPERFGTSVGSFHRENTQRLEEWPYSLLATSTHDTKRSEDVRARINVLSEIPDEWKVCLGRWARINKKHKTLVNDQPAPDPNGEYLLYQTLLGVWPLKPMDQGAHDAFRDRVERYMEKATKEAKVHTSWVNPNQAYDDATRTFIRAILENSPRNLFLREFRPFQEKIALHGMYNSLSQVLLKIASPGVPDIHPGNEVWDFSLVDPDNRRPVDYDIRRKMLWALKARASSPDADLVELARELVNRREDGGIKLFVTWVSLQYRREHRDLFLHGAYVPIEASGSKRNNVCAFARTAGDEQVLVVVPRLLTRLVPSHEEPPLGEAVWHDTSLLIGDCRGDQTYRNLFTGERVTACGRDGEASLPAGHVFASFPVALLEQCPSSAEGGRAGKIDETSAVALPRGLDGRRSRSRRFARRMASDSALQERV